jgi:hypothetical protein
VLPCEYQMRVCLKDMENCPECAFKVISNPLGIKSRENLFKGVKALELNQQMIIM